MKKNSIVFKLFWITFSFFAILLLVIIGFQRIFFHKLYLNKKIRNTKISIQNFANEYNNYNWTTKETLEKLNTFSEKNNAYILIMNEYGEIKFRDNYEKYTMTLQNSEGHIYTVNLENLLYINAFNNFTPIVGEEIYVEGMIKNDKIEPFKVKKAGTEYFDENIMKKYKSIYSNQSSNYKKNSKDLFVKEIKGRVISIDTSFKNRGYEFYRRSLLWNKAYNYWLYNNFSKFNNNYNYNEIKYSFDEEPNAEIKDIIFVKHIKKDYTEELIFAITSLQPINEATNVINDYIIYLILLALVLIIVLSFIYSKIISRPLIEMNNTAKKMAELDFSIHSKVNSNDELGSLSNSLNTLSYNLNTSITKLKNANEKLQDDIEKERKQEQIRKEFVANVSHEIKTPLGIIKGFAEGIKDGIYKEKRDYYLDVIIDEIEKMDIMLKEMLELTKLESKSYKLSKDNFNIAEVIIDVSKKFQHNIEKKKLCVSYDIKKYIVLADRGKIEQVIINLFSNAVKYTESHGEIHIKTHCKKNKVYVHMSNTSENLSNKDIDKIWDRFYRIDKSRSRALGGTGLGLSIVKNILEAHGSEYGVRNVEKGIEFYFNLNISS